MKLVRVESERFIGKVHSALMFRFLDISVITLA